MAHGSQAWLVLRPNNLWFGYCQEIPREDALDYNVGWDQRGFFVAGGRLLIDPKDIDFITKAEGNNEPMKDLNKELIQSHLSFKTN